MNQPYRRLKGGAVFGMVVGDILLIVAVIFGFFTIRSLHRADEMRGWRKAEAEIVSCELIKHRGNKGGTNYRVEASYRYEVDGKKYEGDRVSLHSGSDNIGCFHQDTYSRLESCRREGRKAECWVNPANPADAILVRKLRPEMLGLTQVFIFVFGGVGIGMSTGFLFSLIFPNGRPSPDNTIRMNGSCSHVVSGILALAWNGLAAWMLWLEFKAMAPEIPPWYLWLPLVVGLAIAAIAAYNIGRFLKYGTSTLALSPMPAVPGKPVAMTVLIPGRVSGENTFNLELQCIHQYTIGSGKHRHTNKDILWSETRQTGGNINFQDKTELKVDFEIPAGLPATTAYSGSDGNYWLLKVSASTPGIDYKAEFDVPVVREIY